MANSTRKTAFTLKPKIENIINTSIVLGKGTVIFIDVQKNLLFIRKSKSKKVTPYTENNASTGRGTIKLPSKNIDESIKLFEGINTLGGMTALLQLRLRTGIERVEFQHFNSKDSNVAMIYDDTIKRFRIGGSIHYGCR